jgi:hypothetical protein
MRKNLSDLEFFIRQTAKQLMVPEPIVDRIIRDQWKYANKASLQLKEIEFKDIGTIYPSPKKVAQRLKKLKEKHEYSLKNTGVENPRAVRFMKMVLEAEEHIKVLLNTKYYGKTEGYLEKQGVDPGWYKEQRLPKGGSGEGSSSEDGNM